MDRAARVLEKKINLAPFVRSQDKVTFIVSVSLLCIYCYTYGAYPNDFHYDFFSVLVPILILIRFVYYYQSGNHYFLLDWCYFGTLAALLAVNTFSHREDALRAAFLYSNGALAFAVASFRNSLVFHRIDYSVSLAIHAMPMLTMVQVRWWSMKYEADLPMDQRRFAQFNHDIDWPAYIDLMIIKPYKGYFLWLATYGFVNFVVRRDTIEKQNYLTLYKLQMQWKGLGPILRSFGIKFAPIMFLVVHFVTFSILHLYAIACFHYEYLNKFHICWTLFFAFKNGADFYMDYFAKRYEKSIQALPTSL